MATPQTPSVPADDIMTLKEIARYLKVSEKTIFRMVQASELPGVKISSQWRFVRSVINDWLASRMYGAPRKELLHLVGASPQIVPITRLVSDRRILLDLQPGSRRDVLAQLVETLTRSVAVPDASALVNELLEREDVVTTAIGHGVAFPHVRDPEAMPFEEPCVVLGVCRRGTDFGALDGRRTHVFALPCTRSEVAHLRLMAKLSLLFRKAGVLRRLREAETKKAAMEVLAAADAEILGESS